uniref:Uncharacterized protein n=1 Tax=Anguilla anguilla TaxID=7936 RepID=A0A0E9TM49_ANGAN
MCLYAARDLAYNGGILNMCPFKLVFNVYFAIKFCYREYL